MVKKNYQRRLEKTVIWLIVSILRFLVSLIPRPILLRLGAGIGMIFHFFSRKRAERAAVLCSRFLTVSRSEARHYIRLSYCNLGRSIMELLRFHHDSSADLEQLVEVTGLAYLEQALARGKGVVLVSGHIGNWELAGAWLGKRGYPIKVIGAPQEDPRLTNLLSQLREKFGVQTIWKDSNLRKALECLKNRQILGIMLDQDGGEKGCLVPFLGLPARTSAGPVRLAQKTGSWIIPFFVVRDRYIPNRHRLEFFPGFSVEEEGEKSMLKALHHCNNLLSSWIKQFPDQWMYEGWLYERWEPISEMEQSRSPRSDLSTRSGRLELSR